MLIHKIIIYDDKVEIYYNYTDKKSPDDNRRDSSFMAGSDTSNQSPPKNIEKLLRMGGFSHFIPKSILKNLNFFIVELFITFENNEYKKQVRKKYEFCNTLSSMVIFLRVKTGLALFETAPYNVIILLLKLKSMLYYHSHPDYCYFCERQHYI